MFFRQVITEDLGCASYVLADGGEAVVVDPRWDVAPYLAMADEHGLRIAHVVETHTHADHLSGRGRLAASTGATLHVPAGARARDEHEPLADGDRLEVGDVRLTALATPGHRPEHTALVVEDRSRAERPWAVLTGDSLFVGDLARPDLAVEPREGARALFASLRRLLDLPDDAEVWPGHIGGSLCGGAGMSEKPSSTIGMERAANPLVGVRDEDEFVRALTAGLGPQPPDFERIVALNRGPLPDDPPPSRPLTPARVRGLVEDGAVVVDAREPHEYDGAHIPGSLSVTAVTVGVGTRAAWVVDPDADVVVVAASDADAGRVARMLQAVGILRVRGHLAGGIGAWRQAGEETAATPAIDVAGLADRLRRGEAVLLDVREDDEWRAGHVPGALHVPYHELRDGRRAELEGVDRPLAVACSAGIRSGLAASLLERAGVGPLIHVARGGVEDLPDHGTPLAAG